MAKGKNKGAATAASPKCTCDDPFKCACGNRPERPSRGHKWYPEEQIWAGKGHKQKGASGQIATVSEKAKVTETGKTQVAQWQQLPSQLLMEFCRGQKRPPPKFKDLGTDGRYKFRCIVPDSKDTNKDLFFIPAHAVGNEEQGKEESALLALLQLTPNLPHERKLPEPYKTTWLNAIRSQKEVAASKKTLTKKDSKHESISAETSTSSATSSNQNSVSQSLERSDVAVASTQLTLGTSYVSQSDQRLKLAELRRQRNAQIRKHENLRIANQNHPVFMSASIRLQIEQLLRGDSPFPELDGVSDDDEVELGVDDEEDNLVKAYVIHRLHGEGFTKRQAMNAFEQWACNETSDKDCIDEDEWDRAYEACLQWLLVHLNEDQLPEGFDPRGGTLDVIVQGKSTFDLPKGSSGASYDEASISFSLQYGVTVQEASAIQTEALQRRKDPMEFFWNVVQIAAGVGAEGMPAERQNESRRSDNRERLNDELETLRAIFDSELTEANVKQDCLLIRIALEDDFHLFVSVSCGIYPSERPTYVAVSGKWKSKVGAAVHVELAKFVLSLALEEPMIFAIHSCVQGLLHSTLELGSISLIPFLGVDEKLRPRDPMLLSKRMDIGSKRSSTERSALSRRPRDKRKSFWTISPSDTPPAVQFPQLSAALERARKALPAAASRGDFLAAMKEANRLGSRVVLVTGETGSGKSTQLPAYLLENDPIGSKIVVVQPRRIAATGVANRVAEERGEKHAGVDSVGYVVRGDTAICNRSRLVFCTTGILLRQFQNDGALDCISTIIVDEVHERRLDIDVLLGLLKKILPSTPHLQVVLMSATLDAERFKTYWGDVLVPHIHVPGRTFPVSDYLLEDVFRFTGYVRPKKKKKETVISNEKGDELTPNDLDSFEVRELICQLIKYVVSNKDPSDDGSILVFLAGAPEIQKLEKALRAELVELPLLILPLHGGLQPKEQSRVFHAAKKGVTKVVLATNIAETSVTIPDCTVVIDTGREKQASYDPSNRMPLLVEKFASKASMNQRRGRAGRVREGTCYKLITRTTFDTLNEHSEPEIQRVALDQTLLQLVFIGVESRLGSFTNTLLDPPNKKSLEAAVLSLQKMGALERGSNGNVIVTPLGAHLASIPAPPLVGKLLVMGSILGCRSAALAMAAGISLGRSFFDRVDNGGNNFASTTVDDKVRRKVLEQRAIYAKEAGSSDHALFASVFLKWRQTENGMRRRFCESLGVSHNALCDMALLFNQLDVSLGEAGFSSSPESDRYASSWRIIQACAVSAMSPNQLVKVRRPIIKYHETAEGAKQKDGEARELSFFIRADSGKEERVFIHPSSINFSTGNYSCPILVYNSMVRTTKPYLRDVTECSAYALLLFGGELEVQASKGVVVVDGWIELAANARIGSLVGGLRRRIDTLLAEKIVSPVIDLTSYSEMKLVVKLIRTDGLGR